MFNSWSNDRSTPSSPIVYSNGPPRFNRSVSSDVVIQRHREANNSLREASGFPHPAPQFDRPLFDKRSQTSIGTFHFEAPSRDSTMENYRESAGADYTYLAGDENNQHRYSVPQPRTPSEVNSRKLTSIL